MERSVSVLGDILGQFNTPKSCIVFGIKLHKTDVVPGIRLLREISLKKNYLLLGFENFYLSNEPLLYVAKCNLSKDKIEASAGQQCPTWPRHVEQPVQFAGAPVFLQHTCCVSSVCICSLAGAWPFQVCWFASKSLTHSARGAFFILAEARTPCTPSKRWLLIWLSRVMRRAPYFYFRMVALCLGYF